MAKDTAKKCPTCGTPRDPKRPYCVPCHNESCKRWHQAKKEARAKKAKRERERRASKKTKAGGDEAAA